MVKEDKKIKSEETENKTKDNKEILNGDLVALVSSLLCLFGFTNKSSDDFKNEYLKDLYHSLDKRLSILESKSSKKKFF